MFLLSSNLFSLRKKSLHFILGLLVPNDSIGIVTKESFIEEKTKKKETISLSTRVVSLLWIKYDNTNYGFGSSSFAIHKTGRL